MLTKSNNYSSIIAFFESSWGEVDWLAPVLCELKPD